MYVIGYALMCITIIWGIVFLFGYNLTIKEKIKTWFSLLDIYYMSCSVCCVINRRKVEGNKNDKI